jgi:hypothetical protein
MIIPLYQYAILQTDLKKNGLKTGDIVLIIDYIKDPDDKLKAYVAESFNALGQTLSVFTLPANQIAQFKKNQVLHVRNTRKVKETI